MSCQTTFSCPITIPTGLPGASITGPAGADGAAILSNTVTSDYVSSGLTDQSLTSYTLPADTCIAKDILEIEAIFQLTTTFVGSIYISFGGTTVASYTVQTGDVNIIPPTQSTNVVSLKAVVYFKTVATQQYTKEAEMFGQNVVKVKQGPYSLAVNTASDSIIDVRCNPTAGTATLLPLTVKLNNYAGI